MLLKLKEVSELPLVGIEPYGLILCGGGGAGRWQAGVLSALAQQKVLKYCKVIIGTSVGGLNALLFGSTMNNLPVILPPASDKYNLTIPPPLDESELNPINPDEAWKIAVEVWESITKNSDVYDGAINSVLDKLFAGIGFIVGRDAVLPPNPLHNRLESVFGSMTIGDIANISGIEVIVSALDLNTQMEEFYCSFGEDRSMLASDAAKRTSAIPGIFKSIPGSDSRHTTTHWHVDGGVGANNPFIALNIYNNAFPGEKLKKAVVIYCYPDVNTDIGITMTGPEENKKYQSFRDVLLRTIGASMNAQEQITEKFIEDKVEHSGWDVLALYPSKAPCDAIDFTKVQLLQEGYDYAVAGKGYSYKDKAAINIIDFLKRK